MKDIRKCVRCVISGKGCLVLVLKKTRILKRTNTTKKRYSRKGYKVFILSNHNHSIIKNKYLRHDSHDSHDCIVESKYLRPAPVEELLEL